MEELQTAESAGNHAAEAVGVEMEESEIGEEAQLGREVAGNVCVVEVHACHHAEGGIAGRRSTVDSHVGAHIGAIPVGSEVGRVGEDGGFPSLQADVGLLKPGVFKLEAQGGIYILLCRTDLEEKGRAT